MKITKLILWTDFTVFSDFPTNQPNDEEVLIGRKKKTI